MRVHVRSVRSPPPCPGLLLLLLLLLRAQLCWSFRHVNATRQRAQSRAAWVLPEGYVKTSADILREFRYPTETYHVLTEDGFILQLDRIPNPGRYPIFVANPILSSSPVYLYQGPRISLGFLLFDAGFDVWMGNYRGTIYSRDSIRLSETDDDYWKFSFHEHGVYDNPGFINFILKKTNRPDLAYVSFSMGSTSFLTMASMRPEMKRKVRGAFLMAPVASLYHSPNSLGKILIPIHNTSEVLGDNLRIHLFPHSLFRLFGENFCPTNMGILCNEILWFLFDSVRKEDYVANCPDLASTWPSGGSLQTFWHYTQQADVPESFRLFSFQPEKNKRLYGKPAPPNYPLQRITIPVYMYTGDSDTLVTARDFRYLRKNMKSIQKVFRHPDPLFSHADFVFSRNARLVNLQLIKDLKVLLQSSSPL